MSSYSTIAFSTLYSTYIYCMWGITSMDCNGVIDCYKHDLPLLEVPVTFQQQRSLIENPIQVDDHLVDVPVIYEEQRIFIDVPIQVQQQATRGAPSHFLPQIPGGNLVDVPIKEDILVDVPVVLQTVGMRSSSTVLGKRPREEDKGWFDVLIEEDFTVDVPVLSQTSGVPSSSTFLGRIPHEEDYDILRAPLGTFNAPASTSSTGRKSRMSRSRRLRFTPITLPRSPEVRAALRDMYAAHKRAMRNCNRATEPVLHLTASAALRQRKSRTSRTVEQMIAARSANTLQHRSLRSRLSQLSRNVIPAPNMNAQNFRKAIQQLGWGHCVECKTKFLDLPVDEGICKFCKKDKMDHPEGSLYSAENNMDPREVPIQLSRLTPLECLLIARVHPMFSVYRVKGQQYKYSGNVINFVQDVKEIARVLPYKPGDLSAILIVKRIGNNSTKEFVVRREYVRQALAWLKRNHRYYKDDDLIISDANIEHLPENGVPDDLPNMEEDAPHVDRDQSGNETEDDSNNGPEMQEQHFHVDEFETAGTVGAAIQPDQQSCIRRALEITEAGQTTAELPFTGEVIDEFTKEGYITMAFPTLFPYGTADLRQSRYRKVNAGQYFQHLMKYHDGRFARDSRFRYFAWNSLTRWRALSLGSVYVKNFPCDGELSIQSIRDMVSSGDMRFLSRISYYAKQMRGTRAYWYTRLKELIAMVKQLGPPTIFFTLSAADLQWPELFALLDPENRLETLDPIERNREKARLLNENPLVASWFFQKRVQLFFKEYLKKEFLVVDYWYRFEWQHRGSGHVHGFLWLRDAPDTSDIATNEQVRRLTCEYFDKMICTWNPDPTFSVDRRNHPCAKKIPIESNLDNDDDDYKSLVNCVMRHTKCGSYCLRRSKTTRQQLCRFKFPMEFIDDSKLVEDPPNSNMYRFVGRRNDQYVNSHHRGVLQTWRANIDWSAVTTIESVTHYIAKYAAKSEPASKNYIDTLGGIVNDQRRPCQNSTSVIKRLLIKNASERDICAQEVCHLLPGWHLTGSSRKIVVLNLSENQLFSSQLRRGHGDGEEQEETNPNFFGKYLVRPENFENTTLIEMAKKHYSRRGRWHTSKVEAIIRILPEFVGIIMPDTEKWESFCRQQVLLNSCYRSYEGAKRGFHLWSECYADLSFTAENQSSHIGAFDDEFEDESDLEDEADEDWMLFSGMGPNNAPEGEILLGSRTLDLTHDWSESFSRYPSINKDRRFVHSLGKAEQEASGEYLPTHLDIALSSLSRQQKAAHDMVLQSMREGSTIRLIVSGGAGTGKSTLINAIVHSIRQLFGKNKAVKIMAPTGVAAYNIG
ncbi:hypothetical protein MKW94_009965, partial [Papaver nudicaule]|nr:hypothetical protein [Papaver nudicaule]